MRPAPTPSGAALVAVAALAVLGLIGGWLILLSDGFHHAPHRYTNQTIFVSGPPATVMAAILFALSAVAVAALVQAFGSARTWYVLGCGCVLIPPLLFAVLT